MASKLFEFQEQFMIDAFLTKLTQFENTGSKGKDFFWLGILMLIFHFRK